MPRKNGNTNRPSRKKRQELAKKTGGVQSSQAERNERRRDRFGRRPILGSGDES